MIITLTKPQNAGDEAIFFSTQYNMITGSYYPVVASLNQDCSLDLTLPYDGADLLQV
jgi:hypothetical protein